MQKYISAILFLCLRILKKTSSTLFQTTKNFKGNVFMKMIQGKPLRNL